jgi:hypothetical protein
MHNKGHFIKFQTVLQLGTLIIFFSGCEVIGHSEFVLINNSSYDLIIYLYGNFERPILTEKEIIIDKNGRQTIGGRGTGTAIAFGQQPVDIIEKISIFEKRTKNLLIELKRNVLIEVDDNGWTNDLYFSILRDHTKYVKYRKIGFKQFLFTYEFEITDDLLNIQMNNK